MSLTIEKNGLFQQIWNKDKREYERKRVKKMLVWQVLREPCEIAADVTLLDLFRVVDKYKLLKVFVSQYSWCSALEAFHAQAEDPTANADEEANKEASLEYLEIYWHRSVSRPGPDKQMWFDLSSSLHAFGPNEEGVATYWSVSCSSMAEIAHLPVKLNTKAEFWDQYDPKKIVFSGHRNYCLLDILDAIYWEISFCGDPQEKQDFREMLRDSIETYKKEIDDEE